MSIFLMILMILVILVILVMMVMLVMLMMLHAGDGADFCLQSLLTFPIYISG